jgi:hypothetical protein
MGISFSQSGSFKNTMNFLTKMNSQQIFDVLSSLGEEGVNALSNATPILTGRTSESWTYEVHHGNGYWSIYWENTDLDDQGTPIAIMLQYGHGTGTGGYVQGRDYINPVMKPIFDRIADTVWKVVTSS